MLGFIWHLRGSISLDGIRASADVLDRVEALLAYQGKIVADRGADHLNFGSRPWRESFDSDSRTDALSIFDRGRFWIEPGVIGESLNYDLNCFWSFVICLSLAAVFFAINLRVEGNVVEARRWALSAFGWLYGANVLIALVRAPRCIRRAVNND